MEPIASVVLETMFSASPPATPTFSPETPEVADAESSWTSESDAVGAVAATLMTRADRLAGPVVFSTVAVLLATVSLIATATPTLVSALAVVVDASASVVALLSADASMLMVLCAVTVDESTKAWVVGVNLVIATAPAIGNGKTARHRRQGRRSRHGIALESVRCEIARVD